MNYTLKKSLGQHFLKDETVSQRMIAALKEYSFEKLLEVGPGGGALTRYLLKLSDTDFKAVELDDEKVDYLLKVYPQLKDKIIAQNFLEIDPPFTTDFVIIGNFPYNISTQILFKAIEWRHQVPLVIGMFQKEVAERAASKEGSKVYGVLSVLLQAFYEVKYLFDVPPESFTPPPKVMSGVILLQRREDVPPMKSEKIFFTLVKTAFNQRRKTLRNGVKSLFSDEILKEDLFNQRAETLTVEEFASLTFRIGRGQ